MLLVCTGCGKQFRAPDASGKSYNCKSCGAPLEPARASTPGAGWVRHARAGAKPFPWVLVSVIGGAFLIGIVVLVLSKSKARAPGWARAAVEREERERQAALMEEQAWQARAEARPLALHEEEAVALVREYLSALDQGDEARMRMALDLESYFQRNGSQAGLTRPWEAMTTEEKRTASNRFYTDQLSPAALEKWKSRDRSGERFIQSTGRPGEGGVSIELRDASSGEIVERTYVLAVGPRRQWQIVDIRDKVLTSARPVAEAEARKEPGRSATGAGKDPAKAGDESELHPTGTHRVLGGGREIRPVEFPEDISSEARKKAEELVRALTDPNASRESVAARKQLVELGRPAVPALLNRLVGLDLGKEDDVLVANLVDQTMREITGQDSGFAPHITDETLGGSDAKSKEKALRRWFGWWYSQGHLMKGSPKK